MRPKQLHLSDKEKIALTSLGDLARLQACLRQQFANSGGRPSPAGIWQNRTFDSATGLIIMRESDWAEFPVVLQDVPRGDRLRGRFKCYAFIGHPDSFVETKAVLKYLEEVAERLRASPRTPVVEWNLTQINAALQFGVLMKTFHNWGVSVPVVDLFEAGPPEAFETRLREHLALAR